MQYRPRAGDGQDHEYKQGLGEVLRFQISDRRLRGRHQGNETDQDKGPESEYYFDLAQQMPQAGVVLAGVRKMQEFFG